MFLFRFYCFDFIVETLPTNILKPTPFQNQYYFHQYEFNQQGDDSTPKVGAVNPDSSAEEPKGRD